jgi:predicted neutral ceramidase superfamily lipid hydrolase
MTARRTLPVGTGVVVTAVATVSVGLGLVAAGAWRQGLTLAGIALGVAGMLRLVLSVRLAGALRVRGSRWIDAVVMLALGTLLVVLAIVVPDRPLPR